MGKRHWQKPNIFVERMRKLLNAVERKELTKRSVTQMKIERLRTSSSVEPASISSGVIMNSGPSKRKKKA